MSIYDPLATYLEQRHEDETELTFSEIEEIIGRPLPASARKYPAWWANDPSHSIGRLMIPRGMKVECCRMEAERVSFRKTASGKLLPLPRPKVSKGKIPAAPAPSSPVKTWDACLVSCVSMKRDGTRPAKDLYNSPLFLKSRAFAERFAKRWFILSAKYGLVYPDKEIMTYDQTLKTMSAAERKQWAYLVLTGLQAELPPGKTIVILAGNTYTENLIPELTRCDYTIDLPLQGLRMGERLARLDQLNHG